jgi:hypothetical protein
MPKVTIQYLREGEGEPVPLLPNSRLKKMREFATEKRAEAEALTRKAKEMGFAEGADADTLSAELAECLAKAAVCEAEALQAEAEAEQNRRLSEAFGGEAKTATFEFPAPRNLDKYEVRKQLREWIASQDRPNFLEEAEAKEAREQEYAAMCDFAFERLNPTSTDWPGETPSAFRELLSEACFNAIFPTLSEERSDFLGRLGPVTNSANTPS